MDLKKRVKLSKLIIAHDSMEVIHEASSIMLQSKLKYDDPLYKALHDTIISSYGRAFTEMQPLGSLPSKYKKLRGQQELKRVHAMLMYYRHKNVGHTDFVDGRIRVYPMGTKFESDAIAGMFSYSVLSQSFAPTEIINIQKTAGWIAGTLIHDISVLGRDVFGDSFEKLTVKQDLLSKEEVDLLRKKRKNRSRLNPLYQLRQLLERF